MLKSCLGQLYRAHNPEASDQMQANQGCKHFRLQYLVWQ